MTLDLRGVVGIPGASLAFEYSPDLTPLIDGAYIKVLGTPTASGVVYNEAGAVSMKASVSAELAAQCSRCLREFTYKLDEKITAALSESETANEDSVLYYITDMRLDTNEIIVTELLLDMEMNPLCRKDCPGLCPDCGKDLGDGACGCEQKTDPRLAVLSKLLDSGDK